jgi:hypothetical protein
VTRRKTKNKCNVSKIYKPPTPKLTLFGFVSSRKALLRAKTSIGGPVVTSANREDMVNVNSLAAGAQKDRHQVLVKVK